MAQKIYFKWCVAGHLTARYHPLRQDKCPDCDAAFYERCQRCDTPLPSEDLDPGYAHGNMRPDKEPPRPQRCARCRRPFPWHARPGRWGLSDVWGWWRRGS